MIRTLEKRIVLFALFALTVVIVVNTAFNIESYRRDYRDSLILRGHTLAGGLQTSIEKVLDLGIPLHEISGLNDRCATIADSDTEITYCLIEDHVGLAIFGSEKYYAYESSIAQLQKVENGNIILRFPGTGDYYDIHQPLYAADGSVAGRVRIGFPVRILSDKAAVMIRRSMVVLVGAFALASLLTVLFVKRDVVRPLRRLEQVASKIAGGDFEISIPPMETREMGELAHSLGEMAESLRKRDREIRQNYLRLEDSNRQLRYSYELQEQTGRELSRSREMYRSLLNEASDAIVVSDDEHRIVMINKAAESLFAINHERAEGMPLTEFLAGLHAAESDGLARLFDNALDGQSLETEIRFVRPSDKSALVGWAKCSPVVGQDGSRVVQTIVRDVTREREVTTNLEKSAQELERLNVMKDSFLGVASHELKTPLTVIIGYTELLLGEMAPLVGEQALPMVGHIHRSAERLSKIVRDMVDVTLLDNQNIRLRCQEVNLKQLVRSVAEEMNFFVKKRHQHLLLELGDDVDTIWCDEERINQVLINLVSNAIKFTPDEGTVRIGVRSVTACPDATGAADGPWVEISVRDTGIGIAAKDRAHVFDKFYEVGEIEGHFTAQSAFKGKGTGLGLTIARGFVELHGGTIRVESDGYDPHAFPGSTFFVRLPVDARTVLAPT